MPKLYNNNTGEVEDVPFQEVNEAIVSGNYGFQPGPAVPLENASGEVYLMPANKAADIIRDHAWKFPSQEKTTGFFESLQKDIKEADEEARLEDEYGDAPVQAALFGATRGVTLGLSDPLWRSLGVSAERLRELEKRQPGISTTTEIGGALVPLLLPEPTSSTAAAARLGLLAARGVTGATATAGRVVARRLASQASKQSLARAAVPLAVGGAVEGALYGIGETISEDALENKEMSAEAFVGNMGVGILLGGGGGILLGGGKEIIKRSAQSRAMAKQLDDEFKNQTLKNAQDAGERFSSYAQLNSSQIKKYAPRDKDGKISHGGFGRAIRDKITVGASSMWGETKKGAALLTGADRELVEEFFAANPQAKELRRWAFASGAEKQRLANRFKDEVQKMYDQSEMLVKILTGGEKLAQMRKLLEGQDVGPVKAAVFDMLERFRTTLDTMESNGAIYLYSPPIAYIRGALFGGKGFGEGLQNKIINAKTTFDVFRKLDQAKRLSIDPHLKFGKMLQATEEATINNLVRRIRTPLKNILENKKIFGEAGQLQKRINNVASDYLDFQNMFRKNFTLKHETKGRYVFPVSFSKINNFLQLRGRFHANASPQKLSGPGGMNELMEQQRKVQALAEGLEPETPQFKKIIAGVADEGGESQTMDDIIDAFTEHNAKRQKSWDELVLGKDRLIMREGLTDLRKSIDKMSKNLEEMQENYAASYKLKDMAGHSYVGKTLKVVQTAEEVLNKTKEKMKSTVRSMLKPATKAGKVATRAAKAEGSAMQEGVKFTEELKGRKPKSAEEEQERFKKETDEISQLKADPDLIATRLGNSMEDLSMVAPDTSMAVFQTAQRAVEYAYKSNYAITIFFYI